MNKPLGAPQLKVGRGTTHRAGEQARLEHSPPHSVPIYVLPRGGAEKQLPSCPWLCSPHPGVLGGWKEQVVGRGSRELAVLVKELLLAAAVGGQVTSCSHPSYPAGWDEALLSKCNFTNSFD